MADKSEERLLCADDHAVEGRLLSLEVKIASLPMLRDLTRVAFWAVLVGTVIVILGILGIEALVR
jgi:hypothetical protein